MGADLVGQRGRATDEDRAGPNEQRQERVGRRGLPFATIRGYQHTMSCREFIRTSGNFYAGYQVARDASQIQLLPRAGQQ